MPNFFLRGDYGMTFAIIRYQRYIGTSKDIAMIFVNTNLAAATRAILAMITSWIRIGKPDVGMSLNGALAGLVAITAPCASVSPLSAVRQLDKNNHPIIDVTEHAHTGLISTKYFPSFG